MIEMIVTKTDSGQSVATLDADAYSREAASICICKRLFVISFCETSCLITSTPLASFVFRCNLFLRKKLLWEIFCSLLLSFRSCGKLKYKVLSTFNFAISSLKYFLLHQLNLKNYLPTKLSSPSVPLQCNQVLIIAVKNFILDSKADVFFSAH